MNTGDFNELASRLCKVKDNLNLPVTSAVAVLVTTADCLLSPNEGQIRSKTRNHQRSPQHLHWLWPCSLLPQAVAAIGDPRSDNVGAIVEFFCGAALLVHLADKRHLKQELAHAGFAGMFPFCLVVNAVSMGRSRSLYPSRQQAKHLTDIEFRTAFCISKTANFVSGELSAQFETHRVAKLCGHCHRLYLDLPRPRFCSDTCGKAFQKRKSQRSHQS